MLQKFKLLIKIFWNQMPRATAMGAGDGSHGGRFSRRDVLPAVANGFETGGFGFCPRVPDATIAPSMKQG